REQGPGADGNAAPQGRAWEDDQKRPRGQGRGGRETRWREPPPAGKETPGTKASLAMPIKEAAPTCAARPLNPVDGTAPGRGRKRLALRHRLRCRSKRPRRPVRRG